jgi:glutamyl-tRNA synthetase
MRGATDERLVEALETILPELDAPASVGRTAFEPAFRARLLAAMPGLKERAKTLRELWDNASFLYATRPLALDEKAAGILGDGGRNRLSGVIDRLEALPEWSAASTEGAVRAHAEAIGVKLGQVAQPLRAALTGRSQSPGLFDVMVVLGREESLERLRDQRVPRA